MDPNAIMSSVGDADGSKATQGGDEFEEIREQVRLGWVRAVRVARRLKGRFAGLVLTRRSIVSSLFSSNGYFGRRIDTCRLLTLLAS